MYQLLYVGAMIRVSEVGDAFHYRFSHVSCCNPHLAAIRCSALRKSVASATVLVEARRCQGLPATLKFIPINSFWYRAQ